MSPPAMGLSTRLLHRDHHATYYAGLPRGPRGETLRRHGDHFRRVRGDFGVYFVAGGRVDDTMNLGGIKVSSAEIEKVLNTIEGVVETAAIAVPAGGAGPAGITARPYTVGWSERRFNACSSTRSICSS